MLPKINIHALIGLKLNVLFTIINLLFAVMGFALPLQDVVPPKTILIERKKMSVWSKKLILDNQMLHPVSDFQIVFPNLYHQLTKHRNFVSNNLQRCLTVLRNGSIHRADNLNRIRFL